MGRKEYEIMLPALPERVWNWVTAVKFWPLWINGVAHVQAISTAEPQLGTTFEVQRVGQHKTEQWIIAEWEVGRSVRFTEYHQNIQLGFNAAPNGAGAQLQLQVEWPNSSGMLGFLAAKMTPGGRWARSLASSSSSLIDLFVFNRDIKLLYGMGEE
jgi:hypothetical protein